MAFLPPKCCQNVKSLCCGEQVPNAGQRPWLPLLSSSPQLKSGNMPLKPFPIKAALPSTVCTRAPMPHPLIRRCLAPPSTPSLKFYRSQARPFSHLQDSPLQRGHVPIMSSSAWVLVFVVPPPREHQRASTFTPHQTLFFYSFLALCKYNWKLDLIVFQNFSIVKILDSKTFLCACMYLMFLFSLSLTHFCCQPLSCLPCFPKHRVLRTRLLIVFSLWL